MIGNQHLWGESWDIYRDKSVWVVGFRGKKGGRSSMHFHEHMVNTFYVLTGYLSVFGEVNERDEYLESPQYIHPFTEYGESYRVGFCDSMAAHQLNFVEDTEGIETYYALPGHEIDENDIVRLSPGRAPSEAIRA